MIGLFVLATLGFVWSATGLHIDAGFAKQLPLKHPYMATFVKHQQEFGGANRLLVAIVARDGNMFTPGFFEALKGATDEVFFLRGVDRARVQSLFTPNVRYTEVVEDGIAAGNVIPDDFTTTPEGLAAVRRNILKAGIVGRLVANDFSGAIISAELLEFDPTTGQRLDFLAVAKDIETRVREKFDADFVPGSPVDVHIIGFAKVMGDMASGAQRVVMFFLGSFFLTGALVFLYAQSHRLSFLTLTCAVLAVVWQLGVINLLGFGIDPMSILVPFLVFAIAVSHGMQMISSFGSEVFDGADGMTAARNSFRRLLLPGWAALATDVIGFVTILFIQIRVIQEIAIAAGIGVAAIILTNLVLLPVALSYVKFDARYPERLHRRGRHMEPLWRHFSAVATRVPAIVIVSLAVVLGAVGAWKGAQVQIGDLHRGVPELRADSRYNTDSAVVTSKFSIGVDVLNVIAETKSQGCVDHGVMTTIDDFSWHMVNLPGVQSAVHLPGLAKTLNAGWNEGSPKWRVLARNQSVLTQSVTYVPTSSGLLNADCSVMPVMLFTRDHKAETIEAIVAAVKQFESDHGNRGRVVQTGDGQRGRHGGDQRGRGGGAVADHGLCLRGGRPAVPDVVQVRARHAVHSDPAGPRVAAVLRADDRPRDRVEGQHAARGGARRRRWRGLRHLSLQPLPELLQGGRPGARGVLQDARGDRQRRVLHRPDPGDGSRDLDVLAAQVPGGHGPAAGVPVRDEHDRRAGAAPGAGVSHPAPREAAPVVTSLRPAPDGMPSSRGYG